MIPMTDAEHQPDRSGRPSQGREQGPKAQESKKDTGPFPAPFRGHCIALVYALWKTSFVAIDRGVTPGRATLPEGNQD